TGAVAQASYGTGSALPKPPDGSQESEARSYVSECPGGGGQETHAGTKETRRTRGDLGQGYLGRAAGGSPPGRAVSAGGVAGTDSCPGGRAAAPCPRLG